jgi:hypothetical protein
MNENWIIEEADPDVGIFGDSIVHACAANEDFAEATTDVAIRVDVADARMVVVTTTFTCPACGDTESIAEQNPRDWFEEFREVPMFEVVHAGVVTVEA